MSLPEIELAHDGNGAGKSKRQKKGLISKKKEEARMGL
jgi:hypothetical protein